MPICDAIGIDLGTTFTRVAVCKNGQIEVVPNQNNEPSTPSVVAIRNGEYLLGEEALKEDLTANENYENNRNVVLNIKRLIGRHIDDVQVDRDKRFLLFGLSQSKLKLYVKTVCSGEEKYHHPEQITGVILSEMKNMAEKHLQHPVRHAVITVPAFFNNLQRKSTVASGKIAGFDRVQLINEPTAAVVDFHFKNSEEVYGNKRWLVFHLGGGTFNISIISLTEGHIFRVESIAGDAHLGGVDFDQKLIEYFIKKFKSTHDSKCRKGLLTSLQLRRACERAKIELSKETETTIKIDFGGMSQKITRKEFENECSELFNRIETSIKEVLDTSKKRKSYVDRVLLVGESTQIPKVREILEKFFDKKVLVSLHGNPDNVVFGAALQATLVASHQLNMLSHPLEMHGVIPHTIRIGWPADKIKIKANSDVMNNAWGATIAMSKNRCDGIVFRIIEKTCERKKTFWKIFKYETKNPITIGEFVFEFFDGVKNATIDVDFKFDENLILQFEPTYSTRENFSVKQLPLSLSVKEVDLLRHQLETSKSKSRSQVRYDGNIYKNDEAITVNISPANSLSNTDLHKKKSTASKEPLSLSASVDGKEETQSGNTSDNISSIKPKEINFTNSHSETSLQGKNDRKRKTTPEAPENLENGTYKMLKKRLEQRIIGIDLGTSSSRVAVYHKGKVEVLHNEHGSRTTLSAVKFTEHEVLVGEHGGLKVENSILNIKLFIGKKIGVQSDGDYCSNNTIKNKSETGFKVDFRDRVLTPEEICAFILRKLKKIAENYLNETVTDAVIVVPACFDNEQRQATIDAATIAGLHTIQLINAPTAAAIAYRLENTLNGRRNLFLLNFGGGSLDVSIIKISDSEVSVIATSGDSSFGGVDFDECLMKYFIEEFQKKFPNKNLSSNKRSLYKLRKACVEVKRKLSLLTESEIDIDSLFDGEDLTMTITRKKFEELCDKLFVKLLNIVETVFHDIKIRKSDINDILIVGGSTRIPKVQAIIRDFFGGKEFKHSVNIDEACVYGAAALGAKISEVENENIKNLKVVEPLFPENGIQNLSDGRLTSDDIRQIIAEEKKMDIKTENYHKLSEAKNKLEEYILFALNKFKTLDGMDNVKYCNAKCEEASKWLHSNENVNVEEVEQKLKHLKEICQVNIEGTNYERL